jgi:hypothetical protein
METAVSIAIGLGLAAASGLRVFLPMFALSLALRAEWVTANPGLEWLGSTPALLALGVATLLEVAAYYIPWVDNLLDSLATPAAVVAGVLLTATVLTGFDPMVRWALAIIVGGGVAGTVQGATTATRSLSSLTTGGLANPVVATVELGGALLMAIFSLLLPFFALALLLVAAILTWRFFRRRRQAALPTPA